MAEDELGFSLELVKRNQNLLKKQREDRYNADPAARNTVLAQPMLKKTGTTICGLIYSDGVVLASDTRSTSGSLVLEKACHKIHRIAQNIWACGAGTSADLDFQANLVAADLELLRLDNGRVPRVECAVTLLKRKLFRYQGYISAYMILGGVDATGAHLEQIYAHGSTQKLKYASLGSGSMAAMSVLETGWKPDLAEPEAKALAADAIRAGIFNDLGSGGNVDVCVVRRAATAEEHAQLRAGCGEYCGFIERPFDEPMKRKYRKPDPYYMPRGTTCVVKEEVRELERPAQVGAQEEVVAMDTS